MITIEVVPSIAMMFTCETQGEGINALRGIEKAGRVSHRSEDRMGEHTWERFITSVVLNHGDWSITEHEICQVLFICDRGISHEIVRHRLGAYTQESTRFVNYSKKHAISFIAPFEETSDEYLEWSLGIHDAVNLYERWISRGIKPEIARSVLPTSLATNLLVTFNLRMWRHFFLMRTTAETHPQLRHLTIPLLEKFKLNIPLLYEDIVPGARQSTNLEKAR